MFQSRGQICLSLIRKPQKHRAKTWSRLKHGSDSRSADYWCAVGGDGVTDVLAGERTPYDHRVNSERPPCGSQRQSLRHQAACFGGVNLVQPRPAQAPTLRLCSSQSGDDAVADQISLEFGDRREHMKEQATTWGRRVDRLVEHHEIHSERLQLAAKCDKVMDATREAIKLGDGHDVDLAAPAGGKQAVQGWTAILRPGNAVVDELGHGPAPSRCKGAKSVDLVLGCLAGGADPAVDGGARRIVRWPPPGFLALRAYCWPPSRRMALIPSAGTSPIIQTLPRLANPTTTSAGERESLGERTPFEIRVAAEQH